MCWITLPGTLCLLLAASQLRHSPSARYPPAPMRTQQRKPPVLRASHPPPTPNMWVPHGPMCADVTTFQPAAPVDAVVLSFCHVAASDKARLMANATTMLKSGEEGAGGTHLGLRLHVAPWRDATTRGSRRLARACHGVVVL